MEGQIHLNTLLLFIHYHHDSTDCHKAHYSQLCMWQSRENTSLALCFNSHPRVGSRHTNKERMKTSGEISSITRAHFKWTHGTDQRMQYRSGHTELCLINFATTWSAWQTERKLQAIPFSSFPSHCHPIFSCSWSTVYTASISWRAWLGDVVFI